ncbi:hypothetical protein PSAN_45720 [Pseudomonas antarctica]|uniref:Transposase n=1 Tax=Pseudomonas antarctica TaxID=219572 RepID=A0ABQ6ZPQ5_9PSED|nr:hypothetical protein PSAN_45720 [Pseudomonas antarctica]
MQHDVGEPGTQQMRTSSGSRIAYNVHSAADAKYCLMLHHDVRQEGIDNRQLDPMAKATQEVLERAELCVTADAGYSSDAKLQAC